MRNLIVLGGSRTACDVVRHARESGYQVTAASSRFDDDFDVRRASVALLSSDSREALSRLLALADKDTALIATSDHWLRFIVLHRNALESAFGRILHPDSTVVETCLDKMAFARFCENHDLPSPKAYPAHSLGNLIDGEALPHPLMIRASTSAGSGNSVPKAVEVRTVSALRDMLSVFAHAGVEPLGTQSLLGENLEQMSVGFVRSEGTLAFVVSKKLRPFPRACAAGTLAETVDPGAYPQVVDVARRLLVALDYNGMGEIEILITADGRPFVIELNARPHLQYALMTLAQLDVLNPLVKTQTSVVQPPFRHAAWIDFRADLYRVFSRREGALTCGDMTIFQYVSSVMRFWFVWSKAQLVARFSGHSLAASGPQVESSGDTGVRSPANTPRTAISQSGTDELSTPVEPGTSVADSRCAARAVDA